SPITQEAFSNSRRRLVAVIVALTCRNVLLIAEKTGFHQHGRYRNVGNHKKWFPLRSAIRSFGSRYHRLLNETRQTLTGHCGRFSGRPLKKRNPRNKPRRRRRLMLSVISLHSANHFFPLVKMDTDK